MQIRHAGKLNFILAISLGLIAGLVLTPAPARAQGAGAWEVSLFGGGYFGSRISLTPTADTKLGIGPAWGLRVSFGIAKNFALETSYSHATPDLKSKIPGTETPIGTPTGVDVNTFSLDGLFGFGRGRLKGYAGIGLGFMNYDPSTPTAAMPESTTRFTANLTLGGKYYFTDNFGARLDARYQLRVAPSHVSTIVCGQELGCRTFTTNLYSSAEITGGVLYRFGGPSDSFADSGSSSSDKNFWRAAGEVSLMILLPYTFNRYISNDEFAQISFDTIGKNLEAGFGYDRDHFSTNQSAHPYHGSLFFNSARSNGYNYWESGAFALSGSFLWETLMEVEPPAINDLVNTTMGGMVRGEIQHRLSRVVLDTTASGMDRFWGELGSAFINPMGALNRLLDGKIGDYEPNPPDRLPSSLHAGIALGYRHTSGDAANPDQGLVTVNVAYGDPFAGEIKNPFDSFTFAADLAMPGGTLVSRIEERGILKGWEETNATDSVRHIFAVNQEYLYSNNEVQTIGAQMFSGGMLSRFKINDKLAVGTDFSLLAAPMAGIKTTNADNPLTGRNYDYGPGGGGRLEGRLYASGREVFMLGYIAAWNHTTDGSSNNNFIQYFRAVGRVPIVGRLGAGAAYAWYNHKTTYAAISPIDRSQSEWRAFATWAFY